MQEIAWLGGNRVAETGYSCWRVASWGANEAETQPRGLEADGAAFKLGPVMVGSVLETFLAVRGVLSARVIASGKQPGAGLLISASQPLHAELTGAQREGPAFLPISAWHRKLLSSL